jgi:GNAT superfamily N-acetyltransferase
MCGSTVTKEAVEMRDPHDVRLVPVAMMRPLRLSVLRKGWPEESVHTERDDDPDTLHLAAFAGGDVIGVVTLFPDPFPEDGTRSAARFRWMAVDEAWRGRGAGEALIRHSARLLQVDGIELMWATGRDSALGFYERLGFRVIDDGYVDVNGIGHHHVVIEPTALLED